MAPFESWSLVFQGATILVSLAQLGAIFWGIAVMRSSNANREASLKAQNDQHTETMAALHAQGQVFADIGASLREQSAGIRALLERTP